jgi:FAD/FMN-containing dehydrogenase
MAERKELAKIVGSENVLDDLETLEAYSKDQSFALPRKPLFVAKPENVDEVQGIVKWANQTGAPLVPLSSGPPRFYGDTVPTAAGAVVVDLSRMKRIIKIDSRNRVTMIEPGVTYSELQPELAKHGLRLTTPLLPRSNKSVVASRLERQPTLVPKYQWTLLEPLRCLEVVWGDGSKLWTGEAGEHPPSLEEKWDLDLAQLDPIGPGQVDYYRLVSAAQGSMGIVTWATLRCEVLPQLHKLFFIPAQRLDDLIDCTYKLTRVRLGDEFLLLNSSNLAYILGEGTDQITALKGKFPPWVIIIGIAGRSYLPKERVEFQEKDVTAIVQQFGLKLMSAIPGARGEQVLDALLNPSRVPYWKLGYKGGCQDIFFLTTLNRTPEFIKTMYFVAEGLGYSPLEIGIYVQPLQQGVSCHFEFSLPYNPDSQREVTKMRELFTKASEALLKQGAFFSRPYGIWADMEYNRAAQTTILLKKVKGIFDPNNVLNPGKLCF